MSVLVIPTFDDPFYTQTTTLEGRDYIIDMRYCQRERCWYLSLALPDGTALVSGIKVVCKRPLLKKYSDARLPPGVLMAVPGDAVDVPPDLTHLAPGCFVELIYFDAAEVAATLG